MFLVREIHLPAVTGCNQQAAVFPPSCFVYLHFKISDKDGNISSHQTAVQKHTWWIFQHISSIHSYFCFVGQVCCEPPGPADSLDDNKGHWGLIRWCENRRLELLCSGKGRHLSASRASPQVTAPHRCLEAGMCDTTKNGGCKRLIGIIIHQNYIVLCFIFMFPQGWSLFDHCERVIISRFLSSQLVRVRLKASVDVCCHC